MPLQIFCLTNDHLPASLVGLESILLVDPMANTFGAASKWSDVLNDARCVALGTKGSPRCKREIDESPIHELILLLNNLVLAVSLTNCTRKRKDFETAKTVVARELRSPGTAHSCAFDEAEFSTRNGMHAVKLYVKTWPERFVRSGLVAGEKCVESAAEDEKQN